MNPLEAFAIKATLLSLAAAYGGKLAIIVILKATYELRFLQ
jgi:hypothetical protein